MDALRAFVCTQPSKRMKRRPWRELHPRPWELALQREIHTLSPHCSGTRVVLLGEDDDGIAAITVAEMEHDPASVIIECVAVALRCRRQGGSGYGDEAIEKAIEWAVASADAADLDRVLLTALTDPRNEAGRALALRHGFGLFSKADGDSGSFDAWQMQVVL